MFHGAWGAVLAAGLLAGFPATASAATYTLTVEPNYPAAQIREVYGPLVAYLNRSTGHRFTVRSAANFNEHWRELRSGAKVDFVFEEGHFFDYRRQRSSAIGIARTQEDSAFVIAVADPAIAAEGRDGIVGRTVASLGAPNLAYVLVFDAFRNPLAQPEVRAVSSKWSDGPDLVFSGDVEGTLLPAYMASENPALTEIWRSRAVPGRVFSASPELPQDVRQKVAEALLKLHEDGEAYAVMTELRTERLVGPDDSAYSGLERLLVNSFGYVAPAAPAAAPTEPLPEAPAPAN
ncbi:hypothetical protein GCM10028794_19350 [Silanimonas algicola]